MWSTHNNLYNLKQYNSSTLFNTGPRSLCVVFHLQIKPLHDAYQKEIEKQLWEPLNVFWAECYEKSKKISVACVDIEMESRQKFQVRKKAKAKVTLMNFPCDCMIGLRLRLSGCA